MTTLAHRSKTAVVVIDAQNAVMAGAYQSRAVIAQIQSPVDLARIEGTEVIWVQHNDQDLPKGSPDWEYVPQLSRLDAEVLVHKNYGDSFEGTELEKILAGRGVGHLVVAGAETDACIRSIIHGAFTRGYDVTLVADAHTAGDKSAWGAPDVAEVIAHTNLYWQFQTALGRTATVATANDVQFGAKS